MDISDDRSTLLHAADLPNSTNETADSFQHGRRREPLEHEHSTSMSRKSSLPRPASMQRLSSPTVSNHLGLREEFHTPLSPASPRIATTDGIHRPGSPSLRLVASISADNPFPDSNEDESELVTVQTARPAVHRTQSEAALESAQPSSVSAPATAREPFSQYPSVITPSRPQSRLSDTSLAAIKESSSPHSPGMGNTPCYGKPFLAMTSVGSQTVAARRDTRNLPALERIPHHGASELPVRQSMAAYVAAELRPGPSYSTADVLWGQTERDRVYNALMAVPYQLERLMWVGFTLCGSSFLAVFTLLPLRVVAALMSLMRVGVSARSTRRQSSGLPLFRGDQLYDLLCATMFGCVTLFLWSLRAGSIYFWVKDMTQEFLKLSVLHSALDLADKICCSFSVDVLEALAASCTSLTSAAAAGDNWHALSNVASDASVALALLLAHGGVLMMQALVFGVAMNSQKHTLLALLIASNFTEIKGTVFKRFDATKLFTLTKQDIVERFHLAITLAFVLAEEAAGRGGILPSHRLVMQCAYVLLSEIVIDVTKHAVVGKFNEIRPGVYREFTKDLCEQIAVSQSHNIHRLVGFEPFGPAALFLRVAMTFVLVTREGSGIESDAATQLHAVGGMHVLKRGLNIGLIAVATMIGWVTLAAMTAALGFALKRGAVAYLHHYEARRGRARGAQARVRFQTGVVASASPTAAAGVAKKES